MKFQVHAYGVQAVAEAGDVQDALEKFKAAIISGAPLWTRPMMKKLDALIIAREAVKRDNAAHNRNDPLPSSAQAFMNWAVRRGYVSSVED